VLKKTHHQNVFVSGHDVLGAIAVVHVKVHNRHAFQAMVLDGVQGSNGHVVEKAKPHGLIATRVVAGGAYGAKRVFQFAGYHGVGGGQGSARSAQGGIPGVHIQRGVGIHLRVGGAAGGNLFFQAVAQTAKSGHMHAAMGQLQGVDCGHGCLAPVQRMAYARHQQPVFNRIQTLRTFGVARPHFMKPTIAVGKVAGSSHNASLYFKKSTTYQVWKP
jgi:hypothetical protein